MERHGLSYCHTHCSPSSNALPDVRDMRTQALVREFAELKVWFAVNEVTGPTVAGKAKHERLCAVVDQLRARNVLD